MYITKLDTSIILQLRVNFGFGFSDYKNKDYMVFKWSIFSTMLDSIKNLYNELYTNGWLNDYKPDFDRADPVFAQKIIIDDPNA